MENFNFCAKSNQAMKFGQLIEHNMRNIFLEKPYAKYSKEIIPKPQPPCFISCIIFEEKYFSCYILLPDQISLFGCLYLAIFGNMCLVIVCKLGNDIINFEINIFFPIKPFFLYDQRVRT